LQELRIYGGLVSKGSYIIVEDTNVNGHPVDPGHGPGPMEAVKKFLNEDRNFIIDNEKEKFFLTYNPCNPCGYLKKVT
jgi:cephalosporin hydroxylase